MLVCVAGAGCLSSAVRGEGPGDQEPSLAALAVFVIDHVYYTILLLLLYERVEVVG